MQATMCLNAVRLKGKNTAINPMLDDLDTAKSGYSLYYSEYLEE
jgi:hypothetical protein